MIQKTNISLNDDYDENDDNVGDGDDGDDYDDDKNDESDDFIYIKKNQVVTKLISVGAKILDS